MALNIAMLPELLGAAPRPDLVNSPLTIVVLDARELCRLAVLTILEMKDGSVRRFFRFLGLVVVLTMIGYMAGVH